MLNKHSQNRTADKQQKLDSKNLERDEINQDRLRLQYRGDD